MNLLDENIRNDQRLLLQYYSIHVYQIGVDIGRKGMQDDEIIPLLHKHRNTTFFTRDLGFINPELCHPYYCLVCLAVRQEETATFILRLLRHPQLNTIAKRLGSLIYVSHSGFSIRRRNVPKDKFINW